MAIGIEAFNKFSQEEREEMEEAEEEKNKNKRKLTGREIIKRVYNAFKDSLSVRPQATPSQGTS